MSRYKERYSRMGKYTAKAKIGEFVVEGGPGAAIIMDLGILQLDWYLLERCQVNHARRSQTLKF